MRFAPLLQQSPWRFDWRSALIGAVFAWLIAALVYRHRANLQAMAARLWAPVQSWRARMQSSVEEKYLAALRTRLRALLLFTPKTPEAPFVPPHFLTLPPLPTSATAEELRSVAPLRFSYPTLFKGHPRLLITGTMGDGRTTALALAAWQVSTTEEDSVTLPHFPLWIDLTHLEPLPDAELSAREFLAELATRFLPRALPKWILGKLETTPVLVLVDNWESLPPERRATVAQRLATAANELPESIWLIAVGQEGYGPLVEADFVPVEILPRTDDEALHRLFEGHAQELGVEAPELGGEALYLLMWARETGDRLGELTLRSRLYLTTDSLPEHLTDVLEQLLEIHLPIPEVGSEWPENGQEAQRVAINALEALAHAQRFENQRFTFRELEENLLLPLYPPEAERPPRFEATVQNLLRHTLFLRHEDEHVAFGHHIWRDYFAARALLEREDANALLLEHLHDSAWNFILECYVGLSGGEVLAKNLLKQAITENDLKALLRAARWAILAPAQAEWRKIGMKALAQSFVKGNLAYEERLAIGRALALIAGETARPFYLQTLRHPNTAVRAVALRGLGWTGGPRETQVIAAALNDGDAELRTSAVRALGDLGTSGAIRLLSRALPISDEHLMLTITETLAGQADGWEALKEATQSEDLMVRRAAAHGLGHVPQPWAVTLLKDIMRNDPQWLVRSAAEASLSALEQGEQESSPPPPPRPQDATWLIQWAAREGLGVGVGEAALQSLLHALEVGDTITRMLAAHTLACIGREEHLEDLAPLLEAEEEEVRQIAIEAHTAIERRYRGVMPEGLEPEPEDPVESPEPPSQA